jgi:hypothetical protein
MAQGRSGRVVFGVNASVSVALVLLVAAVALVVRPPAPPGIAAFAPQAAKPITHAPPGQSSVNGSGSGACAASQACTGKPTPSPTAAGAVSRPPRGTRLAGVPSALQCYTWPDGTVTQTFDPQSPPCIASWPEVAKGNGGATSPGVTATEIRVAVPQSASAYSAMAEYQLMTKFFNSSYQLYGRRFVLVPYTSKQIASSDSVTSMADPSAQHADAQQAASLKPFAALDFFDGNQGAHSPALAEYVDTLAQHRILALMGGETPPVASKLDTHDPYEWSYLPGTSRLLAALGGLTCRELKGRPASHSADNPKAARTFAIVLPDPGSNTGFPLDVRVLQDALSGCGITNTPVVYYDDQNTGGATTGSMVKLKQAGVTTLLFFCTGAVSQNTPQNVAVSVQYQPEWVTIGTDPLGVANLLSGSRTETDHTFGVASWNKTLTPQQEPWMKALNAEGEHPIKIITGAKGFYVEMQMLASGVQMAGPHLTPRTFAHALATTEFPNPGAGAAPSYQAAVSFQSGHHALVQDFAGFWFDTSATYADDLQASTRQQDYEASHAFCYVDLGRRWQPDGWPRVDSFFQSTCR